MTAKEIQPGDVVRLKSGGPAMTVTAVVRDRDDAQACCLWYERRGRPHFYYHSIGSLELGAADRGWKAASKKT